MWKRRTLFSYRRFFLGRHDEHTAKELTMPAPPVSFKLSECDLYYVDCVVIVKKISCLIGDCLKFYATERWYSSIPL